MKNSLSCLDWNPILTVDPTGPSFLLALFKSSKNLILLNSMGMTSLWWEIFSFFFCCPKDDMLFDGVLND